MLGRQKRKVEVMKDVLVDEEAVSWFVGKMFNPEDDTWLWIRRISNVLVIPAVLILVFIAFKVM